MRSFSISRVLDRHTRSVAAAVGLLLATLAPAIAPAFAAADILTDRSIELSSSIKSAPNVKYDFTFTAVDSTAGAVVVQFCSNTPLIGEFCNAPSGFSSSSATVSSGGTLDSATANKVIVVKSIASGSNTFELSGITNPSATGPLYARILTYADATAAADYVVTSSASALGSPKDQGSVALSITEGVNVSGKVLETLSFCVAGGTAVITDACGDASSHAPTLELGETVGSVKALSSTAVSTGDIYTQISTNAVGGAVVRMKSDAVSCGGLLLVGGTAGNCYIAPAGSSDFSAGAAKFGVKVATAADGSNPNGTINLASPYNATTYAMNYVDATTGVTGVYGDPIFNTDDKPVNNKNQKLTFGASISNQTPAGKYQASLSLVATGKF